jgi:nitrate/nitrite transporter NarK
MRAFHVTWLAFFLCFFGWFGIAPLMAVVREDLKLTADQVANTIIASTAITIIARLGVGWLCDRVGPRLTYTGLLEHFPLVLSTRPWYFSRVGGADGRGLFDGSTDPRAEGF